MLPAEQPPLRSGGSPLRQINWVRVVLGKQGTTVILFYGNYRDPRHRGYGSRAVRLTTTNNHSAARVRQDAEALVRTRCEARLEEWLGGSGEWGGEAKGTIAFDGGGEARQPSNEPSDGQPTGEPYQALSDPEPFREAQSHVPMQHAIQPR